MMGAIVVLLAAGLSGPADPVEGTAAVRIARLAAESGPLRRELAAAYGSPTTEPSEDPPAASADARPVEAGTRQASSQPSSSQPRPPTPGWMKFFLGMLTCWAITMAVYLSQLHNI